MKLVIRIFYHALRTLNHITLHPLPFLNLVK